MLTLLASMFITAFSGSAGSNEDLFRVDQGMKRFIRQHVDPEAGSYRKIQQLKDALFKDSGAALNYAYRATTTPQVTLSSGVADCVAFSFLYVTLARELGLDARFQEVRGDTNWRKMGRFAVQTMHLNVVVYVGHRTVEVDFPRFESMRGVTRSVITDQRAIAHFHNNLGVDALVANRNQDAGYHLKLASKLAPDFAGCLANLGVYLRRVGEFDLAREAYMQARELEPSSAVVSANLAHLLFHQGQPDRAEEIYASVSRSKFQNPFYHYNQGKLALENGDFDKAEKRFLKAAKMLPEISGFHRALQVVDLRRRASEQDSNRSNSGLVVAAGNREATMFQ